MVDLDKSVTKKWYKIERDVRGKSTDLKRFANANLKSNRENKRIVFILFIIQSLS